MTTQIIASPPAEPSTSRLVRGDHISYSQWFLTLLEAYKENSRITGLKSRTGKVLHTFTEHVVVAWDDAPDAKCVYHRNYIAIARSTTA